MAAPEQSASSQSTTKAPSPTLTADHAVELAQKFTVDGDLTLGALAATEKGDLAIAQKLLGREKPSELAQDYPTAAAALSPVDKLNDTILKAARDAVASGDKDKAIKLETSLFDVQAISGGLITYNKNNKDEKSLAPLAELAGPEAVQHLVAMEKAQGEARDKEGKATGGAINKTLELTFTHAETPTAAPATPTVPGNKTTGPTLPH